MEVGAGGGNAWVLEMRGGGVGNICWGGGGFACVVFVLQHVLLATAAVREGETNGMGHMGPRVGGGGEEQCIGGWRGGGGRRLGSCVEGEEALCV